MEEVGLARLQLVMQFKLRPQEAHMCDTFVGIQ